MIGETSVIHHSLDDVDRHILRCLSANGRMSIAELSERVGLSETPCARRVRLLETHGVIKGYHAEVDPRAFDLAVTALISVKISMPFDDMFTAFIDAVRNFEEVHYCHFVAGGRDFMLLVRLRDAEALEGFLRRKLSALQSVEDFETTISIREILSRPGAPEEEK